MVLKFLFNSQTLRGKNAWSKTIITYGVYSQVQKILECFQAKKFKSMECYNSNYTNKLVSLGVIELSKQIFALPQLPGVEKIFCINFQLISNIAGEYVAKVKLSYLSDNNFQSFLSCRYVSYINYGRFHQYASMALYNMFRDFCKCNDNSQNIKKALSQLLINFYFSVIKDFLIKVQPQCGNIQAVIHFLLIYFQLTKDQADFNNQAKLAVQNYLSHPNERIRLLSIKIYGNMIANSNQGVDYALENSLFINLLIQSLKNTNQAKSQKECAWILSNILAGTPNQIDYFIQYNPTIFNDLYQVLNQNLTNNVIKEMNWSIANLYSTCSQKAFQTVYESSIIEQISNLVLKCNMSIVKEVYVQGIQNYLKKLVASKSLKLNIFAQNSFFIINCLEDIIKNSQSQKAFQLSSECLKKIYELLKCCQNGAIVSSNQGLCQNLANMYL